MSETKQDSTDDYMAERRRKRINELAAVYAPLIASGLAAASVDTTWKEIAVAARALAAAVVDAEE